MGDYAQFQLIVHACPQDKQRAVLGVIDGYELDVNWMERRPVNDPLELATTYTLREARLDIVTELGDRLVEVAPEAAWQCWQDPTYEYDGEYRAYHPDLGSYTASCDSEGRPHFTHDEIEQWLISATSVAEIYPDYTIAKFLADKLPKLTGRAWHDALAALNNSEGTTP